MIKAGLGSEHNGWNCLLFCLLYCRHKFPGCTVEKVYLSGDRVGSVGTKFSLDIKESFYYALGEEL
jgi:hypothetical protein